MDEICDCVRVARWFVFKPKIPIWVDFGGLANGKSWYLLGMTTWSTYLTVIGSIL
jgi:hypothetical protein